MVYMLEYNIGTLATQAIRGVNSFLLFFLKHSTDANAHTLFLMNTHTSYPCEHLRETKPANLEIDEVITDAS